MQSYQFLLQVKLCEVNILSNMIAPLKTIFEDDIKQMEKKITKQKKRKQLLESIMTHKPDNLKDRVEKHS
jgi:di/tricarboxylate transporter